MIITATGLHGCGKSHLLRFMAQIIQANYFLKREALRILSPQKDWLEWYRNEYKRVGAYEMTRRVLELCPMDGVIIYDAAHNPNELKALKEADKDTILIGVFCPESIRLSRNGDEDPSLDHGRLSYWHDNDSTEQLSCLISQVEWSFNGCMDESMLHVRVEEFIQQFSLN